MPRRTVLTLQGSLYTNETYQALLQARGIRASMNSVGTWYDYAPMESFIGNLMMELVYHDLYHTRDETQARLFDYMEALYNRRRRHLALYCLSPEGYERLGDHHRV